MSDLAQRLRFIGAFHADPSWWRLLGLPAQFVQLHLASPLPRTAAGLSQMVCEKLRLPEMNPDEAIPPNLLLLDRQRVETVAALAGSVWHAKRLRWIIEGYLRTKIVDRLAVDPFAFAIRYIELSQAGQDPVDSGILIDQIRQDGWRCWQSWLMTLAPSVRARAVLMTPPNSSQTTPWPKGPQRQAAVAIVEHAMKAKEVFA